MKHRGIGLSVQRKKGGWGGGSGASLRPLVLLPLVVLGGLDLQQLTHACAVLHLSPRPTLRRPLVLPALPVGRRVRRRLLRGRRLAVERRGRRAMAARKHGEGFPLLLLLVLDVVLILLLALVQVPGRGWNFVTLCLFLAKDKNKTKR